MHFFFIASLRFPFGKGTSMSHNMQTLLTTAAELRSGGHSWDQVASQVHRSVKTVRQWPIRYPTDWKLFYRQAQKKRHEEAASEALCCLRHLLNGEDDRIRVKAADCLLKFEQIEEVEEELSEEEYEMQKMVSDYRIRHQAACKAVNSKREQQGLAPLVGKALRDAGHHFLVEFFCGGRVARGEEEKEKPRQSTGASEASNSTLDTTKTLVVLWFLLSLSLLGFLGYRDYQRKEIDRTNPSFASTYPDARIYWSQRSRENSSLDHPLSRSKEFSSPVSIQPNDSFFTPPLFAEMDVEGDVCNVVRIDKRRKLFPLFPLGNCPASNSVHLVKQNCSIQGIPSMTAPMTPTIPPSTKTIPYLEPGDRLNRDEFERRYDAMPNLKKAELINGVVYMPSPVRWDDHAAPHVALSGWLYIYWSQTPGVQAGDNGTIRLDWINEPQPDLTMIILPTHGGRVKRSEEGYLEGSPELVIEIASSSVSIDLHSKLQMYEAFEVKEYLVWRVRDEEIDWFVFRDQHYQRQLPDSDGILKSETFPGLWLNVSAAIRLDLPQTLQTLQQGLASPEHAQFVTDLQQKAQNC
jgi:Uma2 family endonuclease